MLIAAPLVALAAWSEPSQAPTGGNPDPPINTGSSNQIKNGGLSVAGFSVFGSTALNGNTYLKTGVTGSIYRYLNFGADYDVNGDVIAGTIGESGYGIRDKDGTLEFKNLGGSWQSIQAILWELCGGPCGGGGGTASTTAVSFLVNRGGANQSVSAAVWTKVKWPHEVFDTNNNFANNRFTPTVAGEYTFTASVWCTGTGTLTCYASIWKNGVAVSTNYALRTGNSSAQTTIILDMNGSTDYVEVYGYQNDGGPYFGGAEDYTYFTGSILGPQAGGSGGGSGSGSGGDGMDNFGGAYSYAVDIQTGCDASGSQSGAQGIFTNPYTEWYSCPTGYTPIMRIIRTTTASTEVVSIFATALPYPGAPTRS